MSGRKKNQRWLVLAHCCNMDGQAASHHLTDKLPFLRKNNVEPVVLSAPTGYHDQRFEHHQVFSLAPSGLRFELRHFFRRKIKAKLLAETFCAASSVLLLPFYLLEKIFLHFDSQWSWFYSAERKGAQLIKAEKFDLIYALGGASSAFLAAHRLSKRFEIPWIAEIFDPLVHSSWNRSGMAYRWNLWMEKIICRHAKAAFWYTDHTVHEAGRRNPALEGKGHVLRPGMTPPDFCGAKYKPSEKLRCSYFGGLTPERNLGHLANALERLFKARPELESNIEVHVYGGLLDKVSSDSFRSLPANALQDHGRLEKDEKSGKSGRQRVLEEMRRSDALVLMHGQGEICELYLPSKIYEYLWALRPIVIFSPNPQNWSQILQKKDHYIIQQMDEDEIDRQISRLVTNWERNELNDLPPSQAYSVEESVARLIKIANA